VLARLFVSTHVKSHSAEGDHSVEQQGRTELAGTTAGNLIASQRMGLMLLSSNVACEVGQMERSRSFHLRECLEIVHRGGRNNMSKIPLLTVAMLEEEFVFDQGFSIDHCFRTNGDSPLSCNLHSVV
jgi:hypothetical protein